jgi:hypothetical protein
MLEKILKKVLKLICKVLTNTKVLKISQEKVQCF